MPSVLSHAFAAVALGRTVTGGKFPKRFWFLMAFSAVMPDFDVIGFLFGVDYGDMLGHRGLTHSLAFAFAWSAILMFAAFRQVPRFSGLWWKMFFLLFIATASHGVLDAFTNGGLGVAFFAPFDSTRYFFPWRPIEVSPIGVGGFFTERGREVLWSEMKFVWLPCAVVCGCGILLRRKPSSHKGGE